MVFLASEESKYITGAEIVIDGGNIIQEQKRCNSRKPVSLPDLFDVFEETFS